MNVGGGWLRCAVSATKNQELSSAKPEVQFLFFINLTGTLLARYLVHFYSGIDSVYLAAWQLWQQGVPMSVIARDIAKPPATVYSYLLYHGGIKPSG